MLIHLNGRAGVGKLTIAKLAAAALSAKLLDNHAITNVAFNLTEFGTPEFQETVRASRDVAFARIQKLDPEIPVILTNALTQSDFGRDYWRAIQTLADARGSKLLAATLQCSLDENIRRLMAPDRAGRLKLTDPAPLIAQIEKEALLEGEADARFDMDVTTLPAAEAAEHLVQWVRKQASAR